MFDNVLRTRLNNGLTVLVRRDDSAPVAAVVTHVKAGYFDEGDDEVGISHVLEHMFFKGTPTRGVGEVARETKAHGGYLNAHTIYDHTSYMAVLPREGFLRGLEIQADAFANALIDAGELGRELEVIIQEAKRKLDAPGAVTIESLYALLHDRHRIRRWRIGREESLRALTRERVAGFHRNFYRPGNTVLAIVGDVDVDATMGRVASLYGGLADQPVERIPGPDEIAPPGFRYREITGDIAQAHFAIGWRTPGTLHVDTPALDLFALALGEGRGSRLYREVRERELASQVSAFNYTPDGLGVFALTGEGPAPRLSDALPATWQAARRLCDDGPQAGELERARRLFEARWLRRLESMEGQADLLASWEAAGHWQLSQRYFDSIMSLEAAQVAAVARRYLDPSEASVLVYQASGEVRLAADAAEASARLRDVTRPSVAGSPLPIDSAVGAPAIVRHGPVVEERRAGATVVFRTAAGVPVLVRQRPGASMAHVGIQFATGSSLDPEGQSGLAMLVGRTALKGTTRRSAEAIAFESEVLGGVITPAVSSDGQGWTLSVPAPRLGDAVALLADVVQHPVFDEAALETERAMALAHLSQLRDDMFRYPVRLATAAAFPGHPYGRGALGSEETLRAVTAEALRAWHAAHVLSAPVVMAVVSGAVPDEAAGLLAGAFGDIRPVAPSPGTTPAWPHDGSERAESRERAQTALAMAFPSPDRRSVDRITVRVLASIVSGLGGRFFEALREARSLAYTVTAYPVERAMAGLFVAYIATSPDLEEEARRGLVDEFERLRTAPVTDSELDRARTYTLGAHAISRQHGATVLAELVDAWLFGGGAGEPDLFEERVRGVTAAGIQALAGRHFDPAYRVEGIVRGTPAAR